MLDAALWRAKKGWRLYLGFALAGLTANLAALIVKAGTKLVGAEPVTARPFALWWSQALLTYTLCGAAAGLIGALVWFHFFTGNRGQDSREAAR
jgi:hypothetical protein